jgi:ribonuclease VapC
VNRVVLDASALLALLLHERGADAVAPHLPRAVLSTVNYSETLTKLIDRGKPLGESVAGLARLRLEVVPFDAEQAATAASLRPVTKALGLSLGDRACLALGLIRQSPVLTADREWVALDIGVRVECVR